MEEHMPIHTNRQYASGFTAIELMIILMVVAILANFGFASYSSQVLTSQRSDATIHLAALAQQEELFFTRNRTYTAVIVGGGDCAGAACGLNQINNRTPNDHYVITAVADARSYTLTATATDRQLDDTGCRVLTINNAGVQAALDSDGADATDNCW